jgi:aromatic-L-amino-acid decarboxylase
MSHGDHALETAGPRFFGYIHGGGLFTSALADLLAKTLNRYTGLSELAPGLVAIEDGVLRWLCHLFGLPPGSGGLATTGGRWPRCRCWWPRARTVSVITRAWG